LTLAFGVIVLALVAFIPSPWTTFSTAVTQPITDVVRFEDSAANANPVRVGTVYTRNPTFLELIFVYLKSSGNVELVRRHLVDGSGDKADLKVPPATVHEYRNLSAMSAAKALSTGTTPRMTGEGVLVVSGGAGGLAAGDVIVAADEHPVRTVTDLNRIIASFEPGDSVPVLTKDGAKRSIRLLVDPRMSTGSAIGEYLMTVAPKLDHPIEKASFPKTNLEGDSSGLAIALYLYESLEKTSLNGPMKVLATGAIEADGTVRPVAGVPQKVLQASHEGVDLVLVPEANVDTAYRYGPYPNMKIVTVATLEEAVTAIRTARAARDPEFIAPNQAWH
jgi:PDZ domain-containing secreted protein